MSGKDLFSAQATDYKKFRPTYPKELFTWISDKATDNERVWDCGTGNGQAAQALVAFFDSVMATDPSERQLSEAVQNPNIHYSQGTAELSGLPSHSVSAVTVAQAFHWFDHEKFFQEVSRVSKDKALLVLWTYSLAQISPAVDAVTDRLYTGIVADFWEKERKLVDDGYRSVKVPFEELFVPKFEMQAQWSLTQWMGYLQTWSAVQTYFKKQGSDPLGSLRSEFQSAWGPLDQMKTIRWPLSVRAFRITVPNRG